MRCPELTEYYFDISYSTQLDRFNDTVKDILIYIGSKYIKNGGIDCVLDTLKVVYWAKVSRRPVRPIINSLENKIDPTDKKIWVVECKIFGDQKT